MRDTTRRRGSIWPAPLTALFVVLLVALFSFSGSVTFNSCQNDERSKQAADTHKEISSRVLVQFIDGTFARCTGAFISINQGEITAISGVAVAFFTFTLWFVGGRQLQGLRESIERADLTAEQQSIDMQNSIAASRKAADAATSAASTAERSLIDIQRALVVPTSFRSDTLLRNDQVIGYRITPLIENTGATIARKFVGQATIVVFDHALPADFGYPDRAEATSETSYVGPRVTVPFPLDIAIQDLLDIDSKKKRGFVYGWVEYCDIFRPTVQRRTEFCVEIEVIGSPVILPERGGASIFGFRVTSNYNGIDEDCFYKPGQRPPIGGLPPPTQPPSENA